MDQVIFLHQGGRMEHEWTCESLELIANKVLPEFTDRDEVADQQKAKRLAPAIERAMARKELTPEMEDADIPEIRPYDVGGFVRGGTVPDEVNQVGTSSSTIGALGLDRS